MNDGVTTPEPTHPAVAELFAEFHDGDALV